MQTLQCQPNLFEVEQTLTKHSYFSRSPLPGFADGHKKYPDKKIHPNFFHWFVVMRQFSDSAIGGWVREKRYIENQSEKCLMLIADIFSKQGLKVLRASNRMKSLDTTYGSLNQSAKAKPFDAISLSVKTSSKVECKMIVQLRNVQNIEQLFKRFYKLKQLLSLTKRIKLKELNFKNKHENSVFLRFVTEKNNIQTIKQEIDSWIQVRRIICKESLESNPDRQNPKKLRTVSIR